MALYKLTRLSDYTYFYYDDTKDIYNMLYHDTGDHEISAEMADWAELACIGDNWTNEKIGYDITIWEG